MDDATAACRIDLKKSLVKDPQNRPKPLSKMEQNLLILPPSNNPLQKCIDELWDFAQTQNMSINQGKTKVMVFNPTKKYHFPPEMKFPGSDLLNVVEEARILGIIISSDLKWTANTDYIISRAMKNIWVLRRLKNLGLDKSIILDVYQKEIRSILEFGAPIWNGNISQYDSNRIEQVQKKVFRLILENSYNSYEEACTTLKTKPLKERRIQLCLKFAQKEVKKEDSIFKKYDPKINIRHKHKKKVEEIFCNTDRL